MSVSWGKVPQSVSIRMEICLEHTGTLVVNRYIHSNEVAVDTSHALWYTQCNNIVLLETPTFQLCRRNNKDTENQIVKFNMPRQVAYLQAMTLSVYNSKNIFLNTQTMFFIHLTL